eukprot:5383012-Pyramimonas_sp.AAC.1
MEKVWVDELRCVSQGFGSRVAGNVLFYLAQNGYYGHGPIAVRLANLWASYRDIGVRISRRFSRGQR